MSDDVAIMGAQEMAARFRDGSLSPVEAAKAALERIERFNGDLNAFNLVDAEGALQTARESEERWRIGAPRGRIDGVPTSIKDVVLTKDWPTLRGSRTISPDQAWEEDSPCVARLREHGAVLLGKTTTPEFGWKGVTDSPLGGITRNPWMTDRTPGGSSGGAAAALAAGMGALAIGTDGGGSIRIPAAFTGVVGLKASFGRVPAYPSSPFGTLAHVGPMARSVTDTALMLNVIAEPDTRDWFSLPHDRADYTNGLEDGIEGLKVAFSPSLGGHEVAPQIAVQVDAAAAKFESLGATVEMVDPQTEAIDLEAVFRVHWFSGAGRLISQMTEEQKDLLEPGLRRIAEEGESYSLAEYQAAMAAREAFGQHMNAFHQNYHLLLTPSLPIPAFETGQDAPPERVQAGWTDWTPFTYPFNLTGQPAISVPCGLTPEGLPAGLQIVGPRFGEALVLRAARAFEQTHPVVLPVL